MTKQEEIREGIAKLEHEQWIYWASSLLPTLGLIIKDHEESCKCETCKRAERWLALIHTPYKDLTEEQKDQDREWADKVLAMEHSQGVVIKVDRELPTDKGVNIPFKAKPELSMPAQSQVADTAIIAYKQAEQDMLKVGYVAVESLIKEG